MAIKAWFWISFFFWIIDFSFIIEQNSWAKTNYHKVHLQLKQSRWNGFVCLNMWGNSLTRLWQVWHMITWALLQIAAVLLSQNKNTMEMDLQKNDLNVEEEGDLTNHPLIKPTPLLTDKKGA